MLGNVKEIIGDLRNFSEIFRKDKTYNNIKSHTKQGFTLSLEDEFLEKLQWGVKLTLLLIWSQLLKKLLI